MQNRNDQIAVTSSKESSLPGWKFKLVLASVLIVMTIALVGIVMPLLTTTPRVWAHSSQQAQVVAPSTSTPSPNGGSCTGTDC